MSDDDLDFVPESIEPQAGSEAGDPGPWKILIVDDEAVIHEATSFAIGRLVFRSRPLQIFSAYSGEAARAILRAESDIALALIDVVMENEHSGLDLVRFIREELNNRDIRLIMRTGQPGYAPEDQVIVEYEVDDYKSKTELTNTKLNTTIVSALRSYAYITALKELTGELETRVNNRTEELSLANTALASSVETLHQSLSDLKSAQAQLVQSEKMAALGHLVAGVAHEINTPIGAVKASGQNIADGLSHAMESMPKLFQVLDAESERLFLALIGHIALPSDVLSRREERLLIDETTKALAAEGIPNARHEAHILVQLRAHKQMKDYLPLLRHPACDLILDTAYSMATITNSTSNINTAVERVTKIIFALKSFSRFDSTGQWVNADMRDGIETILTIYHSQIKHSIELVRHYDTIAPIRCLPDELNQVWTNLIHNALQSMDNKGTLTLQIKRDGDQAVVSIGDSGCGIPEAIRGRIFEPFFTTKPSGEGTGLGLDIVKKIVDKHQGRIEVDSQVGVGSTFRVFLPYKIDERSTGRQGLS